MATPEKPKTATNAPSQKMSRADLQFHIHFRATAHPSDIKNQQALEKIRKTLEENPGYADCVFQLAGKDSAGNLVYELKEGNQVKFTITHNPKEGNIMGAFILDKSDRSAQAASIELKPDYFQLALDYVENCKPDKLQLTEHELEKPHEVQPNIFEITANPVADSKTTSKAALRLLEKAIIREGFNADVSNPKLLFKEADQFEQYTQIMSMTPKERTEKRDKEIFEVEKEKAFRKLTAPTLSSNFASSNKTT